MERWKPIPGYEGFYVVSNLGRVRSLPRMVSGKSGSMRSLPSRIRKCTLDTNGYPQAGLYRNGKRRLINVHRLVATAFISPPPEGMEINHKDGNKANNVVSNLEWVTHRQNMEYAYAGGLLTTRGEQHPNSYIKEKDVRHIRRTNMTVPQIVEAYGYPRATAFDIMARRTWHHVT